MPSAFATWRSPPSAGWIAINLAFPLYAHRESIRQLKRDCLTPDAKSFAYPQLPPAAYQFSSVPFLCLPREDTAPNTACTISPRPASSLFSLALLPNKGREPRIPASRQSHPGTCPSPHQSFQSACSTAQLLNPFPLAADPTSADLPHSSSPYPSVYSLSASLAHRTGSPALAIKLLPQKSSPRAPQF